VLRLADRLSRAGCVRRSVLAEVGQTAAKNWTEEENKGIMRCIADADQIRLPQFGQFLFALLLQIYKKFAGASSEPLSYAVIPFVLKLFKQPVANFDLSQFSKVGSVAPKEFVAFVLDSLVDFDDNADALKALAKLTAVCTRGITSVSRSCHTTGHLMKNFHTFLEELECNGSDLCMTGSNSKLFLSLLDMMNKKGCVNFGEFQDFIERIMLSAFHHLDHKSDGLIRPGDFEVISVAFSMRQASEADEIKHDYDRGEFEDVFISKCMAGKSLLEMIRGLETVTSLGLAAPKPYISATDGATKTSPTVQVSMASTSEPKTTLNNLLASSVRSIFAQFSSGGDDFGSSMLRELGVALQELDTALGTVLDAQPLEKEWPTLLKAYCAAVMILHENVEAVIGQESTQNVTLPVFSKFLQTCLASVYDLLSLPAGTMEASALKEIASMFGVSVIGAAMSRPAFIEFVLFTCMHELEAPKVTSGLASLIQLTGHQVRKLGVTTDDAVLDENLGRMTLEEIVSYVKSCSVEGREAALASLFRTNRRVHSHVQVALKPGPNAAELHDTMEVMHGLPLEELLTKAEGLDKETLPMVLRGMNNRVRKFVTATLEISEPNAPQPELQSTSYQLDGQEKSILTDTVKIEPQDISSNTNGTMVEDPTQTAGTTIYTGIGEQQGNTNGTMQFEVHTESTQSADKKMPDALYLEGDHGINTNGTMIQHSTIDTNTNTLGPPSVGSGSYDASYASDDSLEDIQDKTSMMEDMADAFFNMLNTENEDRVNIDIVATLGKSLSKDWTLHQERYFEEFQYNSGASKSLSYPQLVAFFEHMRSCMKSSLAHSVISVAFDALDTKNAGLLERPAVERVAHWFSIDTKVLDTAMAQGTSMNRQRFIDFVLDPCVASQTAPDVVKHGFQQIIQAAIEHVSSRQETKLLRVPVSSETGEMLGFIRVGMNVTYAVIRSMLSTQLDGLPDDYVFIIDRLPLGQRQEAHEEIGSDKIVVLRAIVSTTPKEDIVSVSLQKSTEISVLEPKEETETVEATVEKVADEGTAPETKEALSRLEAEVKKKEEPSAIEEKEQNAALEEKAEADRLSAKIEKLKADEDGAIEEAKHQANEEAKRVKAAELSKLKEQKEMRIEKEKTDEETRLMAEKERLKLELQAKDDRIKAEESKAQEQDTKQRADEEAEKEKMNEEILSLKAEKAAKQAKLKVDDEAEKERVRQEIVLLKAEKAEKEAKLKEEVRQQAEAAALKADEAEATIQSTRMECRICFDVGTKRDSCGEIYCDDCYAIKELSPSSSAPCNTEKETEHNTEVENAMKTMPNARDSRRKKVTKSVVSPKREKKSMPARKYDPRKRSKSPEKKVIVTPAGLETAIELDPATLQQCNRGCNLISAFVTNDFDQLRRVPKSKMSAAEKTASNSLLSLVAAVKTLENEAQLKGKTLMPLHNRGKFEVEKNSIESKWRQNASEDMLDVEVPKGELWEVSSQLAHLRRDAAQIIGVQRDNRDMVYEKKASRISCSQRWEGSLYY